MTDVDGEDLDAYALMKKVLADFTYARLEGGMRVYMLSKEEHHIVADRLAAEKKGRGSPPTEAGGLGDASTPPSDSTTPL